MTAAVGTKFSTVSTKFQVGTAALALAAAATITPAVAYAAPNLSSIAEGLGDSASLVVDPVISPTASATTDPCASANFKLACYTVEGAVAGTQAIVRGAVIYIGTVAYVLVEGTGEIFKAVGNFLPGPLGDFFTDVGDGVSTLATGIAVNFRVGPYLA